MTVARALAKPPPLGRAQPSSLLGLIQRKCNCGRPTSALDGICEECNEGRLLPKLFVGPVDDPLEREADLVADLVTRGETELPLRRTVPAIQRLGAARVLGGGAAPSTVHRALSSPGEALKPSTRREMERRFERDFSDVRVHHGPLAAQSARGIGARAYTVGSHIVLGDPQLGDQATAFATRRAIRPRVAYTISSCRTIGTTSRGAGLGPIAGRWFEIVEIRLP